MPYRVLTNHLHKRKEKMKTNYILLFALMLMVSLKSSAQIFSGRVIGENQLPVELHYCPCRILRLWAEL